MQEIAIIALSVAGLYSLRSINRLEQIIKTNQENIEELAKIIVDILDKSNESRA